MSRCCINCLKVFHPTEWDESVQGRRGEISFEFGVVTVVIKRKWDAETVKHK